MPKKSPLVKALIGPSGEHFVLSSLYRQGLLAALAPPGTPQVDLLVLSPDAAGIAATIQVKTTTNGAKAGWPFNQKHEQIMEARLFYALVDFKADPPVTYVLPSAVVADVLRRSHKAWLETLGKQGRGHGDTPLRKVKWTYEFPVKGYPPGWLEDWSERWDLIVEEVERTGRFL